MLCRLAACLVAASAASLLTATAPAGQPSPRELINEYLARQAVSEGRRVETACNRDLFQGLMLNLRAIEDEFSFVKGEFETTLEFAARRAAATAALNRFGPIAVCAFADNERIPLQYDADRGTFELTFDRALPVSLTWREAGKRQARTTQGRRVAVTEFLHVEYGLEMAPSLAHLNAVSDSCLQAERYSTRMRLNFPVPRDEAPSTKGHVELLFVGRIVDPIFRSSSRIEDATPDDPREIFRLETWLSFAPTWVHVVRFDGKILYSCELPTTAAPV